MAQTCHTYLLVSYALTVHRSSKENLAKIKVILYPTIPNLAWSLFHNDLLELLANKVPKGKIWHELKQRDTNMNLMVLPSLKTDF